MFNNPFGSFQDTVAEAKEEREQLDRLLTISTPRERLLVAAIALLLVILAAWLFLGNVAHSVAINGVLVEPAESSPGSNRSVQALVWVSRDIAPRIKAGMSAAIEVSMSTGKTGTLDGEVATISAVPSPSEVAALHSAVPVSVHRVSIALERSLDPASIADRQCRIVIEIGRRSPVALLRMKRS